MKPTQLALLSALLSMALASCTTTGQAERMGLPEPAAKAVLKAFPDAVIVEKVQRRDSGPIAVYEARFYSDGLVRVITVAGSGTVLSVAQPMTIGELPRGAADTIARAAGVTKLEKQNVWARLQDGQIRWLGRQPVLYQAQISRDGAVGTVDVLADGTILEGPRWQRAGADEKPETPAQAAAPRDPGVSLDSLPPAAQAAIRRYAAGNPVRRLEPVSASGRVVAYDAEWTANGRPCQIRVDLAGTVVTNPVEDDRYR